MTNEQKSQIALRILRTVERLLWKHRLQYFPIVDEEVETLESLLRIGEYEEIYTPLDVQDDLSEGFGPDELQDVVQDVERGMRLWRSDCDPDAQLSDPLGETDATILTALRYGDLTAIIRGTNWVAYLEEVIETLDDHDEGMTVATRYFGIVLDCLFAFSMVIPDGPVPLEPSAGEGLAEDL